MASKGREEWIRRSILREWYGGEDPPDDNSFAKAESLVRAVLKSAGADQGIDEERLKEAWRSIAGDLVARHASPESLRNGCLVLKVLQPAMRFQLEQLKPQLLGKLREKLGEGVVKSVRFTLG